VSDAQFIGVDVGGTKVAAASLVAGQLDEAHVVPTDTSSSDALLDQIVAAIEVVRLPGAARAVGIGVPSVVEFATGRIRFSVNIPLADLPLRRILSERLGLPVYVDNDGSCAALAEAYEGDRIVAKNLVIFTIGTGVGGGLVLNGRLYRGATGAAAELGHIIIGLDLERGAPQPAPRFPQPGSLEMLASGRYGLEPLARVALGREDATGRDVVAAAQAGDERAVDALRILGERLGVGVANAINTFDPQEVVIGGGVSAAGDLLLAPARESAGHFVLPGVGTETTIRLARRGAEAGVLGAALLALQEYTEDQRETQPPPVEEGLQT
jgi:glucokinase